MGSNWKTRKLEDIAQVVDSRHKTPQYSEDGYPMVRVVDVKGGILQLNGTKKVNDEVYSDFSKGRDPEIGDLIISRVGSYGNVAYVNSLDKFCLGQNTALIIPNDKSRFLYYTLISPQVKAQIEQMVVGAVQKTISLKTIKNLDIPEPPKDIKESISKALGAIDDKIELNNQTNQTLEKMAQTLFKSWFVDFDPVFDNALAKADFNLENLPSAWPEPLLQRATSRLQVLQDNPALQTKLTQPNLAETQANTAPEQTSPAENTHQYFPSEFELTDEPSIGINGWIPKGWRKDNLKSFGKVVTGKTPSKSIKNAFDSKGIPFITPTDVDNDIYTLTVARYLTEYGANAVKNNVIDKGSVCVTCIGSQMGKTVITPRKAVSNQQLNSIILNDKLFRNYVFMNLRLRREELFHLGSSGSTMPILNKSSFENLKILKPNINILKNFGEITEKYLVKILKNSEQNENLTKLRDTLLPKLISGELQIPDLEIV